MRSRTTKSFALSLLLVSLLSLPALASIDRDGGAGRELPIFQRIVHALKHFFTVMDTVESDTMSVPRP
jgi:hypothetical protein